MSGWLGVELYGAFIKLTGELEVLGVDRLSDSINRYSPTLAVRGCRTEPLTVNHPVLSRIEPLMHVVKSSLILICPRDEAPHSGSPMWQETVAHAASINTTAFSLVGDVHLPPGLVLEDHLDRHPGDFLPVTNLSLLWLTSTVSETQALQRGFGLLNPAAILSFAVH